MSSLYELNTAYRSLMERLYDEGAVAAIGVSNHLPHHLMHILKDCNTRPMVNQLEFHPGYAQSATTNFCLNQGGGMEPSGPHKGAGRPSPAGTGAEIWQNASADLPAVLSAE